MLILFIAFLLAGLKLTGVISMTWPVYFGVVLLAECGLWLLCFAVKAWRKL